MRNSARVCREDGLEVGWFIAWLLRRAGSLTSHTDYRRRWLLVMPALQRPRTGDTADVTAHARTCVAVKLREIGVEYFSAAPGAGILVLSTIIVSKHATVDGAPNARFGAQGETYLLRNSA